jgi:CubicO group peptidase (beta-lactamase class C family)
MVLNHTSGLPNEVRPGEHLSLQFDPGTRFSYSGAGFTYLQRVIEGVVRTPLDGFMRRMVFEPLRMTRSAYRWERRFAASFAIGHDDYGSPRPPTQPTIAKAAASLHTTAADYARFLLAMLDTAGIRTRAPRSMLAQQTGVTGQISWGLGWALQETDSGRVFWHWGDNSNSGYTSYVQGDPARRTGFVFLTNSTSGLAVAGAMIRHLTGMQVPAVAFMNHEQFDAPTRRLRSALETRIRKLGIAAGLSYLDSTEPSFPGGLPEGVLISLDIGCWRLVKFARQWRSFAKMSKPIPTPPTPTTAWVRRTPSQVIPRRQSPITAAHSRSTPQFQRSPHAR